MFRVPSTSKTLPASSACGCCGGHEVVYDGYGTSRLLAYALAMYQQVFGRDAELAALADFLTAMASSAHGVVLAGPAGQGKTTLSSP
jgi:hypothetical protein